MISKPWNWIGISDKIWLTPSREFYYFKERWSSLNLMRVLDLGCGKGRHAIAFAKAGFDVTATDLSQLAIDITLENAAANGVKIKTDLADILSLPYGDGAFDAIFSYHVMSHTDTEGLYKAIGEIKRTLVKGGEVFLDLVSKEAELYKNAKTFIDNNTFIMEEIEHERGLPHCCVDYSDILKLFSDFELSDVRLSFAYSPEFGKTFGGHYYIHAIKK